MTAKENIKRSHLALETQKYFEKKFELSYKRRKTVRKPIVTGWFANKIFVWWRILRLRIEHIRTEKMSISSSKNVARYLFSEISKSEPGSQGNFQKIQNFRVSTPDLILAFSNDFYWVVKSTIMKSEVYDHVK